MKLLKFLTLGAAALAVLVWPAAWLLARQAQTVQLIARFDEAVVGVNRFGYEDEPSGLPADIISIYGTPFGEPEAVLFVDSGKIVHPVENPELALLPKGADENPFKVDSLTFLVRFVSVGAAAAAAALLLLLTFLRRKRAKTDPAQTA